MSLNGSPDVYTECTDTEDTETTPLLSNVSTETAGTGEKKSQNMNFIFD